VDVEDLKTGELPDKFFDFVYFEDMTHENEDKSKKAVAIALSTLKDDGLLIYHTPKPNSETILIARTVFNGDDNMNEHALKERLKVIAIEKNTTPNKVWKQLLLERFLARLANSAYQEIMGNLYYVGTDDLASYLIVTSKGKPLLLMHGIMMRDVRKAKCF
jgi:hypothetical protein